jgi:hypothetical protein
MDALGGFFPTTKSGTRRIGLGALGFFLKRGQFGVEALGSS